MNYAKTLLITAFIFLSKVLCAGLPDANFYVVKLSYCGDRKVTRILDFADYADLQKKMRKSGGITDSTSGSENSSETLPKWMMILSAHKTEKEALAAVGNKAKAEKNKADAEKKAKDALELQKLKPKHTPGKHDAEKEKKKRKALAEQRKRINSLSPKSHVPCKGRVGDPLPDKIVDFNPIITTDPHKMEKTKAKGSK